MYDEQQQIMIIKIRVSGLNNQSTQDRIQNFFNENLYTSKHQNIKDMVISKISQSKMVRIQKKKQFKQYSASIRFQGKQEVQKCNKQLIKFKSIKNQQQIYVKTQWVTNYLYVRCPKKILQPFIDYVNKELKIQTGNIQIKTIKQHQQYIAMNPSYNENLQLYHAIHKDQKQARFLTKNEYEDYQLNGFKQDTQKQESMKIQEQIYITGQEAKKLSKKIESLWQKLITCYSQVFSHKIKNELPNQLIEYHKFIKQRSLKTFEILCLQNLSSTDLQIMYQQITVFHKKLSKLYLQKTKPQTQITDQQIQELKNKLQKAITSRISVLDQLSAILGLPEKAFSQNVILNYLQLSKPLCTGFTHQDTKIYFHQKKDVENSRKLIRAPYLLIKSVQNEIHTQILSRQSKIQQTDLLKQINKLVTELSQSYMILKDTQYAPFSDDVFQQTQNKDLVYLLYTINKDPSNKSIPHYLAVFKKQDAFYISDCNYFVLQKVNIEQLKFYIRIINKGFIFRVIRHTDQEKEQRSAQIGLQLNQLLSQLLDKKY